MFGRHFVLGLLIAVATVSAAPCDPVTNKECFPTGQDHKNDNPKNIDNMDIPNHPKTMPDTDQLCEENQVYDAKSGTCVDTAKFIDLEMTKKVPLSIHRRDLGSFVSSYVPKDVLDLFCPEGTIHLYDDVCVDKNVVIVTPICILLLLVLIAICRCLCRS